MIIDQANWHVNMQPVKTVRLHSLIRVGHSLIKEAFDTETFFKINAFLYT